LFFSAKKVRDPTPTPPLEGRGKATGRRPKVGNVPSGKTNSGQLLYHYLIIKVAKWLFGKKNHTRPGA
jgi:hypothetical protein